MPPLTQCPQTCNEQTEPTEQVSCPYAQSGSASVVGQAACVMIGSGMRTSTKNEKHRLGSHALHWGVLLISILLSTPFLLPSFADAPRDWINTNILHSAYNWKLITLSVFSASVFSFGFVHRLGRERVHNSCAVLRRLGPATMLGVAWSAIPSFAGVMLILNMEPIRVALVGDPMSQAHLMLGMLVYLVAFVIFAGFGCLPTVTQAILAGYAFGFPVGFGLALIGFGGASLIGYDFVKRVVRNQVEGELQRCPRVIYLRDALLCANTPRALLIVALLRASPSTPFALTNLLLSSVGISRGVYFFGTLIGMIPRTFAAVLIGQQVTTWTGEVDKPVWILVSGIVALVLLVVLISKASASALAKVSHAADASPIFAQPIS